MKRNVIVQSFCIIRVYTNIHFFVPQFRNLQTEKDSDVVEVWCGGRTLGLSTKLWKISGGSNPAVIGPYKCNCPFMTIIFQSDYGTGGINNQGGFVATWNSGMCTMVIY